MQRKWLEFEAGMQQLSTYHTHELHILGWEVGMGVPTTSGAVTHKFIPISKKFLMEYIHRWTTTPFNVPSYPNENSSLCGGNGIIASPKCHFFITVNTQVHFAKQTPASSFLPSWSSSAQQRWKTRPQDAVRSVSPDGVSRGVPAASSQHVVEWVVVDASPKMTKKTQTDKKNSNMS